MPKRDRTTVSHELSRVFGDSETPDLLGSVIRSDQRRAGRAAAGNPGDDTMTGHAVSGHYDNEASTHANQHPGVRPSSQSSSVVTQHAHAQEGSEKCGLTANNCKRQREGEGQDLLQDRVAEADRMAHSPTTTVTLRLPRELNDWLDEYIHRSWPNKVRKQDLVCEGLRLLFARRGRPGEPIVPTALLSEKSP